jgi:hypothetical protein
MLRMENASASNAAGNRNAAELSLNGLSANDRLSTSCPSLNNAAADSPFGDVSQTPMSTTTDNSTPSHQVFFEIKS